MRRWWLVFALLLSLGVNLGILAMVALHRLRPEPLSGPGAAPSVQPGSRPGVQPGSQPGPRQGPKPGLRPGPKPGSQPGPKPGPQPGPQSGAGPAFEPPPEPSPALLERRLDLLADRLGVEGENRPRFLAIQHAFFDAALTGRRRLFELRHDLRAELIAAAPDRRRVDDLLAELARTQAALEQALVTAILDSRQVLDPVQQREYLRFIAQLGARAGQGGPPAAQRPWRPGARLRRPLAGRPGGLPP